MCTPLRRLSCRYTRDRIQAKHVYTKPSPRHTENPHAFFLRAGGGQGVGSLATNYRQLVSAARQECLRGQLPHGGAGQPSRKRSRYLREPFPPHAAFGLRRLVAWRGKRNCALNPDILCLTDSCDSWQHRRTGDGVGLDCGVGEETSESFGRIGVLGTDCA